MNFLDLDVIKQQQKQDRLIGLFWFAVLIIGLLIWTQAQTPSISINAADKEITSYFTSEAVFANYNPHRHEQYVDEVLKRSALIRNEPGETIIKFTNDFGEYHLNEWNRLTGNEDAVESYQAVGIKIFPTSLLVSDFFKNVSIIEKIKRHKKFLTTISNERKKEYMSILCIEGKVQSITWTLSE